MARLNQQKLLILVCLVLGGVTIGVYWPAIRHPFINIDDNEYIIDNAHVNGGLTWTGILWAFRAGYASNWHPLTWISHMLDSEVFGVQSPGGNHFVNVVMQKFGLQPPGGHHFVNIILHVANSILLLLLFERMTGKLWRSAIVAALFAWHPLHVESVAWASERKDTLSTIFCLLTLMAYHRYAESTGKGGRRSNGYYALALVWFVLGLMSKPMLVTLPCVLLLVDFWPLRRLEDGAQTPESAATALWRSPRWVPLLLEKLPFFTLAFIASLVTYLVQKTSGAVSSFEDLPVAERFGNAVVVYVQYLGKTIWPADLAAFYPYPGHRAAWLIAVCGVTLAAITLVAFKLAGRRPYLLVGWCWYWGTLVPTIGIVQVGSQSMADRYMYIPSIGLFVAAVWAGADLIGRWPGLKPIAAAAAGLVLAGLLAGTWMQLGYWSSSERLFRRAIAVTKDNYVAYNGLGASLKGPENEAEAKKCYQLAVAIKPTYPEGRYNYGTLLLEEGHLDEAIGEFNAALARTPRYAAAQINLGKALFQRGNVPEAEVHMKRAIELDGSNARAHYNLGTLYLTEDKFEEADTQFADAVRLQPDYPEALSNWGYSLMERRQYAESASRLQQALQLKPDEPGWRFNLGMSYARLNRLDEAATQFTESLRLRPNDPGTHYNLALVDQARHDPTNAVIQFRQVLSTNPTHADTMNRLAWILASDPATDVRDGPEALRLAQSACELTRTNDAGVMLTLSAAYAENGRFPEAISAVQKARELAGAAGIQQLQARADEFLAGFQAGRPWRERP